ncbi:uncharacterized protein LOC114356130 isoform X1 [Ostrinia furnacalis]|uniref:uncharacterized protein LOC114356130 isoform X1 n=1 Tax=Ostrinia furnacalis TaxID=93504 RepID=UPI00103B8AF7|nr:uncharacterized protein LOC114356130 isoform X1 [Ostrinia furnacalis]
MLRLRQILIICASCLVLLASARPDSAGNPPLPGPGLSYGGIPYGSMSGNVAEYFRRQAPSGVRARNLAPHGAGDVDFTPIEQWL